MEGLIEKLDKKILTNQGLIYIYNTLKNFNNLNVHTKEDVVKIYKDLLIFEINKDEIDKNTFDQQEFDFFYKSRYGDNPIYIICQDFIKLLICEKKLKTFLLVIIIQNGKKLIVI